MGELLELARDVMSRRGALCELRARADTPWYEQLDAVLPAEIARPLGLDEMAILHEGPDAPLDSVRLTYGSPLLDAIITMACEKPMFAAGRVVCPPQRSRELASAALDHFTARNGVLSDAPEIDVAAGRSGYLIVDYRFQADADERHEGLVRVAIAEDGGAEVPRLAEIADDLELDAEGIGLSPLQGAEENLKFADRAAGRRIEAALVEMRESVLRRYTRDRARVSRYFAALRTEMEAQLARRAGSSAQEIGSRRAKIESLQAELERKLADLAARYAIKATATPIAILRLEVPVRRQPIRARRRKGERLIHATWSDATRAFDPLRCEGCDSSCTAFALCDDALHILCAACDRGRPSPRSCPACRRR